MSKTHRGPSGWSGYVYSDPIQSPIAVLTCSTAQSYTLASLRMPTFTMVSISLSPNVASGGPSPACVVQRESCRMQRRVLFERRTIRVASRDRVRGLHRRMPGLSAMSLKSECECLRSSVPALRQDISIATSSVDAISYDRLNDM